MVTLLCVKNIKKVTQSLWCVFCLSLVARRKGWKESEIFCPVFHVLLWSSKTPFHQQLVVYTNIKALPSSLEASNNCSSYLLPQSPWLQGRSKGIHNTLTTMSQIILQLPMDPHRKPPQQRIRRVFGTTETAKMRGWPIKQEQYSFAQGLQSNVVFFFRLVIPA